MPKSGPCGHGRFSLPTDYRGPNEHAAPSGGRHICGLVGGRSGCEIGPGHLPAACGAFACSYASPGGARNLANVPSYRCGAPDTANASARPNMMWAQSCKTPRCSPGTRCWTESPHCCNGVAARRSRFEGLMMAPTEWVPWCVAAPFGRH